MQTNCLICNSKIILRCRCQRSEVVCENGHQITLCLVHDNYIEIQNDVQTHDKEFTDCICELGKIIGHRPKRKIQPFSGPTCSKGGNNLREPTTPRPANPFGSGGINSCNFFNINSEKNNE